MTVTIRARIEVASTAIQHCPLRLAIGSLPAIGLLAAIDTGVVTKDTALLPNRRLTVGAPASEWN